jgi:endonuclease/exonuclease/phosphatase family metal-dependent hydrolase
VRNGSGAAGDFNAEAADAAIAAIVWPAHEAGSAHGFRDAWGLVHGNAPHAPTFRLFDTTYGDTPLVYDYVFVSAGLAHQVRKVQVDLQTRASDHQPVLVEFDSAATR